MDRSKIYEVYGSDPGVMTRALLEAVRPEQEIPPGGLVVLKPNLAVSKPAESGATTHPGIVGETIRYLREKGVDRMVILESSWIGDQTREAFRVCGYETVAQFYGVPLVDVKKDAYETKTVNGISMQISRTALEADYLINFPVLKGHCQTKMTCALKNMKGCISDRSKREFHSLGLHRPIAALNKALPCHLTVVDGLCGDLDFEEGGTPVAANRMYCGWDPVLLDAYGASLLGYQPQEIPYISMAAELGCGCCDLEQMSLMGLNHREQGSAAGSSRRVRRLERLVHASSACSACYAALIHALARLEDKELLGRLGEQLYIGQDYRGKALDQVGIGSCCGNFTRCVAGCPPKASDIVEALEEELE